MGNKSNKSSLNKTWTNNKSNISTFESLNKNNNNILIYKYFILYIFCHNKINKY